MAGGKAGRPPGSGKRRPGDKRIGLMLSQAQFAYLTWLVNNTKLGQSEEIVALVLLAQKFEEMSPSILRRPTEADRTKGTDNQP